MDIRLRRETPHDYRIVEELTREAFWNLHAPGCNEHYLLHVMRDAGCFVPELDMVAEVEGKVVGNIVYTRAAVIDDGGAAHAVLCFGPIAVLPESQRMGVGRALIEGTTKIARESGHTAVLIYGDPSYYSRFGFVAAETFDIGTPDNRYVPGLQALELAPGALAGISGRFVEDAVYHVDDAAAAEFDKGFPAKELLTGLPSQQEFSAAVSISRPRRS